MKGPDLSLISFVNDGELFPICLLEEINIERKDGSFTAKGFNTHESDNYNWTHQAYNIAKNIILEFNREVINNMNSFEELVNSLEKTGRSSLLLKIIRDDEQNWVTIKFKNN